jgi:hypothetical protein
MHSLFGGGLLSYLMARYGGLGMLAILTAVILGLFLIAFLIKIVKRRR